MLTPETIDRYMQDAAITQYNVAALNARYKGLNGGENMGQRRIPFLLDMLQFTLRWARPTFSTTSQFEDVANYMYSLCNHFGFDKIKAISLNNDGGGYVPFTPTTGLNSIVFPKIQFVVGDGTYMNETDTTMFIIDKGIVNGSLTVSVDGVIIPYGISAQLSYTAIYTGTNVQITFNQPAFINQVVIIDYIKLLTGTATISFPNKQFQIGAQGALMNEGETALSLTDTGIVNGTLNIQIDGATIPYGIAGVASYTAIYGASGVQITFNQPALINQVYLISYEKVTVI